ncbi:hypothetical protein M5689_009187 [Euphorbia peplus]|nr:hypothetical protein M5689_009187 [Euphorbia peplus]
MSRIQRPASKIGLAAASAPPSMKPSFVQTKIQNPKISPFKTPFCAVAPTPLIKISKVSVQLDLGTIYEEDHKEDHQSKPHSSSSSSCFLELAPKFYSTTQSFGIASI